MPYLKMFIAGMALPSFVLPFVLSFAWFNQKNEFFTHLFQYYIPLIWGVWNILYFTCFQKLMPGNENTKLLLTGGLLGLLIAIYGVFWTHMPNMLGLTGSLQYAPLIIAPLLYALAWLYIVDPLNKLLGVKSQWWN